MKRCPHCGSPLRGPTDAELSDVVVEHLGEPILNQVAALYRAAVDGNPTRAVERVMGYSKRTAGRRVQQARAAGLLPPTTKGKKQA